MNPSYHGEKNIIKKQETVLERINIYLRAGNGAWASGLRQGNIATIHLFGKETGEESLKSPPVISSLLKTFSCLNSLF